MSWVAVAIGAGAGLLKAEAVDAPAASRQRTLAAATQRYSPWTGLKADPVKDADPAGSMLQFGATGAALGQGMQNATAQQGLAQAQTRWLNSGGSPMYTQAAGATVAPTIGGGGAASPWRVTDNPWTF